MESVKLGEAPAPGRQRDAIHVALIPMRAACPLRPGEWVAILAPGVAGPRPDPVGIVDPFRRDTIERGEWFWLFLEPGTVTGMRHHWSHPSFDADTSESGDAEMAKAISWMRNFAEAMGVSYAMLIGADGPMGHGTQFDMGEDRSDDWRLYQNLFWRYRAIITGRDVNVEDRGGSTCSC